MLRDWGSRDHDFIALNARVRGRLVELAGGGGSHVAVPLQGSGTFVVEAMLGDARAAGRQAAGPGQRRLWPAHGRDRAPPRPRASRRSRRPRTAERPAGARPALAADPAISHVAAVHCETTSGILNPIAAIAEVVAAAWPPAADRRDERLRRAAARRARGGVRRARRVRQQMPRGRARPRLRDRPRGARSRRRPATPEPRARPPRPVAGDGAAPASGASPRRPTCWPPSIRRSPSTRPRAASPGAARATARTAASWSRACAQQGFETLLPDALQAPIIVTFKHARRPALRLRDLLRPAARARAT